MSNKFGQRGMQELVDGLRAAKRNAMSGAESVDVIPFAQLLDDAADTLEAAHRYWAAVESALI